jgi:BirA family transcriptional regulator, biotin operon repressor / biotin---[acetyl-CoA-carboxylase] ligase
MTTLYNQFMLGQSVIHLDSVDSTNNYTAKMVRENGLAHGTVIMADEQTKGRGQRGSSWQSDPGKNLLFSLFVKFDNLKVANQQIVSHSVSISLVNVLRQFGITADIKWPNDIYVGSNKICGILIENSVSNEKVSNSIIGVGLNVNQTNFEGLNATSIFLETGSHVIVKELLYSFLDQFSKLWATIEFEQVDSALQLYNKYLIGYKQIRKYEDKDGVFIGIIEGISPDGKLIVYRNGELTHYDIKEISFIW